MGALSSMMGGAPSVSASSSASAGPSASGAGTTGNLALNFGGINLGNQDIPLSASSTDPSNAPATLGTVPNVATVVSTVAAYMPYLLMAGAAIALYIWIKKHK